MPIVVVCPGCRAKLNAPDSAAGKQVRCPKPGCGALAPVPALLAAAEVAEEDDAPAPRSAPKSRRSERDDDDDDRPRKKSRRDDDDDDDDRPRSKRRRDADDDDRPRRRSQNEDDAPPRRRPRKAGGGGAGKVIAIVLVGLVVLGGVGFGIYRMIGGGKAPLPPGWKEYTYKDDNFKAAFPKEPQVGRDPFGELGGFGADFGGGAASATTYTCGNFSEPLQIRVQVLRYKSGIPSQVRSRFAEARNNDGVEAKANIKTVRWLGVSATEASMPGVVNRIALTDNAIYVAVITSANGGKIKPEEEAAFFTNFELLK